MHNCLGRGLILTLLVVVVTISAVPAFAVPFVGKSSVSDNGITFTFDRTYQCFQHVDDTWGCIENSPGGGVTVTAMTPSYDNDQRDGWEVNPRTNELATSHALCPATQGVCDLQGLDGRITNLISSHVWGFRNPNTGAFQSELPSLPYTVRAEQSMLKVKSGNWASCTSGGGSSPRTCIESATVLTVYAADPLPACMLPTRPAYAGDAKASFCADNFDVAGLPDLAQSNMPSDSLALLMFGDKGPQVDHQTAYTSTRAHPARRFWKALNGGNPDSASISDSTTQPYPAFYYTQMMVAMLYTMSTASDANKTPIVNMLVQDGIDLFANVRNGKGYFADGGINGGRKMEIMFAGHMTGDSNLLHPSSAYGNFQEDGFTRDVGSEALWGRSGTSANYDACACNNSCGDKTISDPNDLRDGGKCGFGAGCPTNTCALGSGSPGWQKTPAQQRSSGQVTMGNYQIYTHWYLAQVIIVRQLGLEADWIVGLTGSDAEKNAFFTYVDRIGGEAPWNGFCKNYCDGTIGAPGLVVPMFRTYGDGSGPTSTPLEPPVLLPE